MITTVAIGLVGVIVLAVVGTLGYRRACQRHAARVLTISAAQGIAESVLTAPDMSLADIYRFNLAFTFFPQPLYEEQMRWDAHQAGTRFAIPFFLLHGDNDPHTLTSLAREYYAAVEAPAKDLVLLPGGGHCAVLMQPATFLAELRARLDPLTATSLTPIC